MAVTMRDYLKLRSDSWQGKRRDADKITALETDVVGAKRQVKEMVENASRQMREHEHAAAARSSSYDNVYQKQLRGSEAANNLIVLIIPPLPIFPPTPAIHN
ncbi:hypothetical protein T492DRAFT_851466 [Pavlovales sp. CCMP2436]|nr:hypothetical protein T492DRAFT_851466 [Pavlovales sp. CCMP2436]